MKMRAILWHIMSAFAKSKQTLEPIISCVTKNEDIAKKALKNKTNKDKIQKNRGTLKT
jgi:hypothetical protein